MPRKSLMTRESIQERLHQFEVGCRAQGQPMTIQRRAVLEEVLRHGDHPTADQIYDALKGRMHRLSRTTVYRILETLVNRGLIQKIAHPGTVARFDPRLDRHHHLICRECEGITDLQADVLNSLPWPDVREHGFEIQDYCIHFRGICAHCRANAAGGAASKPRNKVLTTATGRSREKRPSNLRRRNTP